MVSSLISAWILLLLPLATCLQFLGDRFEIYGQRRRLLEVVWRVHWKQPNWFMQGRTSPVTSNSSLSILISGCCPKILKLGGACQHVVTNEYYSTPSCFISTFLPYLLMTNIVNRPMRFREWNKLIDLYKIKVSTPNSKSAAQAACVCFLILWIITTHHLRMCTKIDWNSLKTSDFYH